MPLRIAAFVIPLGFDTLAVAVALGLRGLHPLRPALVFTLFETIMPLIGIVAGRYARLWVGTLAAYIGAIILVGIGIHTLRETLERGDKTPPVSFESLRGVLLAGVGISTDEIAMGFPLGALELPIGAVLAAIAVQAFGVTVGGILIGRRVGAALGIRASKIAGIAAGVAFSLLGGYLLVERLMLRHPSALSRFPIM